MSHFKRSYKKQSKTDCTFREVKSLLGEFLSKFEKEKIDYRKDIFEKWPEIIGDKFAKWTKPISFDDNILKVKVISSALYSILINYEKKRLLKVLQNNFPDAVIRDIQFLIG